ncbi:MAG: serine/threonine-protein kinase [Planctomycetota bacterium]
MSQKPEIAHCPPDSVLSQIGAEGFDEELFAAIEIHVESCARCQQQMEKFVKMSQVAFSQKSVEQDLPELPDVPGFNLVRELGRGGAGVVYLAQEDETQRLVALKMIDGGWIKGPSGRARWLAEARAVARVNDVHIVQLYRVEERPQFYLMVFEYVSGGTLSDRLNGPLPPRQAVMIMKTLARALGKIHEAGLLHLDLKPSNILVEGRAGADWSELTLKISDFGISRLNALQNPDDSNHSGPRGTPGFMAPEQEELNIEKIDKPTDIYSLGVIFYLLLTGRLPLQVGSTVDKLNQDVFQQQAGLSRWNRSIDGALERICKKCIEKESGERFITADDLVESLDGWLKCGGGVGNNFSFLRKSRRPWQNMSVARSGAVLAIGLTAVMIFGWNRRQADFDKPRNLPIANANVLDHTSWINMLTRDLDSFQGDQLHQLLAASRVETENCIKESGFGAREIAQKGLLLKNFGLKLNNTLNKKNIEISLPFIDLASRLFQESHRRESQDQWILREFLHCESSYAIIHFSFLGENAEALEKSIGSILGHMEAAANLIPKVTDQRTRLFHETRLMDYCRFNSLVFQGADQKVIASRIHDFELSCSKRFQEDRNVPDLGALLLMTEGRFPEKRGQQPWLMADDESKLQWSWLAYQMAGQIFEFASINPGNDQNQTRIWSARAIDISMAEMRLHQVEPLLLPRIAMNELNRPLASASTFLRMNENLDRAERIEKVYLEIASELCQRFPGDPFAILVLSEAHLQTWKNQLRRIKPEEAVAALRRSLLEARRAAELTPDFTIAREMADDREARLAKFLTKNANNSE